MSRKVATPPANVTAAAGLVTVSQAASRGALVTKSKRMSLLCSLVQLSALLVTNPMLF